MSALLRLTFWICLTLAVVVWSVRAAGQMRSLPQTIAQFHLMDCLPPCWIGIVPGSTTVEEAKARLLATFAEQSGLTIRDSRFAAGNNVIGAVDNAIEGDNFFLYVRFNISELVDGRTETVESIGLFESGLNRSHYALTVADILGAFGAPRGVIVDDVLAGGYEVTLKYDGLDVAFSTYADRVDFTESPRLYLGNTDPQSSRVGYRPWKGFGALALRN